MLERAADCSSTCHWAVYSRHYERDNATERTLTCHRPQPGCSLDWGAHCRSYRGGVLMEL